MIRTIRNIFFSLLVCTILSNNTVFAQTLTLSEFIQNVWLSNQDLQSQRMNLESAAITVREKEGIYDPAFQASLTNKHGQSALGGATSDTLAAKIGVSQKLSTGADLSVNFDNSKNDAQTSPYNSNLSLTFTQPLFSGYGKDATEYSIILARLDKEKAQQDYLKYGNDYIMNAITKYCDYFLSIKSQEIAEKNLEHARYIFEENKKKESLNLVTPYDVMEAQIAFKKAEDDKLAAESVIEKNREALALLVGVASSNYIVPDPVEPGMPTYSLISTDDILRRNPDLKISELMANKIQTNISYLRNQDLPGTFFDASLGYGDNAKTFADSYSLSNQVYSLGLRFQYLFGNKKSDAALEKENIVLEQQKLNYDIIRKTTVIHSNDAMKDLKVLKERISTAKDIRDLSEKFLEIETKKFRLGLITTDKIVQDQSSLKNSQIGYYQLVVNYLKTYYQLEALRANLQAIFRLN
ncbi:MAG: hypothetical protein A2X42_06565 [Candidatus Margulisbacteria bacterium GWF2_38_17]|nr:MAG: hypothetical protein A2X43_01920 [Candidatus Margulisbacteria bacterium GWD2_39_127]OGI01332.1 MAG: hypothetical protein A2X42_06565 [Candidatus Margulisbacteria bacterium GWF2_38_17]OGI10796.1 MAG: hypothetical protein A2X41_00820 [Candidatus Margulisbacteria bacterium GWE2_39_32]